MEKVLGKITSAEFGTISDYPFLFGLQLNFSMEYGSIGDGGKYTFNISKECKWEKHERSEFIVTTIENIADILEKAKVNYVSQLVGKPVEITIDRNCFKDFRILTEVL